MSGPSNEDVCAVIVTFNRKGAPESSASPIPSLNRGSEPFCLACSL
jgi:hypothetical protein